MSSLDDASVTIPVTAEGDEVVEMIRSLAKSVEKLGRAVEILANQQHAMASRLAREVVRDISVDDVGEV